MKFYLSFIMLTLLFSSCSPGINDDNIPDFPPQTEEDIIKYLEKQTFEAVRSDSGLYYYINEDGNGATPTPTSTVQVAYTGSFLNGIVFEGTSEEGIAVNLENVITGWLEGIQLFKAGGKGVLIIPPELAFGDAGRDPIPPGAVLVFDIQLLSVD